MSRVAAAPVIAAILLCLRWQTPPPPAAAAEPVFDCYREVWAWSYSLTGTFVDRAGGVSTYDKHTVPWRPTPVTEQGQLFFTEADLGTKLSGSSAAGTRIDAAALEPQLALIGAAAAGPIASEDGHARDVGSSVCYAYVHDAAGRRYRAIGLGSYGPTETRIRNASDAAQRLMSWLTTTGIAR
jgi:hypothetical protein